MTDTIDTGTTGETDMAADAAWAADRTGERRRGRFGRELGYLLGGLPLGTAAFVAVLTVFVAGVVGFALVVGMAVLVAALAVAGAFARVERRRVAGVTGVPFPEPPYRERGTGGFAGWLRVLGDGRRWRDLAHALVAFPVRVTTFCLAVTWTAGGLGGLLYVTWSWSLPRDAGEEGLLDLVFGISSETADILFTTAVGVVLLATAVPVVRGLTALDTALARGLLGGARPGA